MFLENLTNTAQHARALAPRLRIFKKTSSHDGSDTKPFVKIKPKVLLCDFQPNGLSEFRQNVTGQPPHVLPFETCSRPNSQEKADREKFVLLSLQSATDSYRPNRERAFVETDAIVAFAYA